MAITQADLDRIDSAIATAELSVEIDGRKVTYRSTADLMTARRHIADLLRANEAAASGTGRQATFYPDMILSRERY